MHTSTKRLQITHAHIATQTATKIIQQKETYFYIYIIAVMIYYLHTYRVAYSDVKILYNYFN